MRFRSAMIFVKDFIRMADFYTNALGLKPVEETRLDNWVEFEAGFSLHAIPQEIAAGIQISTPPRPREQDPIKLSFEVEDLAQERKRLEALGVTIIERTWGGIDGVDPEGNVFGMTQMPR